MTPKANLSASSRCRCLPSNFSQFYSHLLSGEGLQFALVRDDGVMLARYPPISREVRLDEHSGFHRSIAADPAGGFYTSVGGNDNVERRVGTRRLPGFPVYVIAGIDTAQIRNEWMGGMAMHLIFGIPATLFLFLTLLAVLRRTRRLYAEIRTSGSRWRKRSGNRKSSMPSAI